MPRDTQSTSQLSGCCPTSVFNQPRHLALVGGIVWYMHAFSLHPRNGMPCSEPCILLLLPWHAAAGATSCKPAWLKRDGHVAAYTGVGVFPQSVAAGGAASLSCCEALALQQPQQAGQQRAGRLVRQQLVQLVVPDELRADKGSGRGMHSAVFSSAGSITHHQPSKDNTSESVGSARCAAY